MIERRRMGFLAKLDFAAWAPEKVVRALRECGYGAVSWGPAHFNPRCHSRQQLRRVVEVTRNEGLEISEVLGQVDVVVTDDRLREDRIAAVEEIIAAAGELCLDTVNVFTGPAPWVKDSVRIPEQMAEGTAWDLVTDALCRYGAAAERAGTYVAIEPVYGHVVRDYFTLSELLRKTPSPRLKVNLDPSHLVLYRNDIPWVIRQLGQLIQHVHMKDAVGVPGVHGVHFLFSLLGEGGVDWQAALGALEQVSYRGFLTVEFEAFRYYRQVLRGDPIEAARLSMQALEALAGAAKL
jgi:sugar phosphate isomerase/epimerase